MAKIKKTDLVEDKVLEGFRTELDLTLKKMKEFSSAMESHIQTQLKVAQGAKNSAKGFKQVAQAEEESKRALVEKEKMDKRIIQTQTKLTQINKIQRDRLAALKVEEQRRNKIAKESAKMASQNVSAYEKLNLSIKKLSDRYKNLVIQEGKETKQTKELRKEIMKMKAARDKVNESLGNHQHKVGQYSQAIRGAVGSLKNLAGALGVVAGIQLFTRVVRDAFNVVKDFDQAQANLASVLGVNREDMAALTEQAKQLGATTKFTASQVSELQLEFAKLGFTQKDIQGVTEATLELAAASGTELGNAATIVGSTIRGFGMDVSETQRVVDVMAKSFSSSSLDIEKFKTAMAAVAPVAKQSGYNIEQTTAMIGILSDRGIDASTAGTGLRNMFLNAGKAGLTFQEALDQINNASDKTGEALKLFGTRGATLGVILAENQAQTSALTETLNDAAGAAGEMADKQLDTLQGSLDLLRSAWEGYILGADGASGASEKLKNIVKFLADNLETILDTLFEVIKLVGVYKLSMKAAATASNLFNKDLGKMKQAFGLVGLAILAATKIFQGFVDLYETANLRANRFKELQEEVAAEVDKEAVKVQLLGEKIMKLNVHSKERADLIEQINKEYGTNLKNIENEMVMLNQLSVAYEKYVKQLQKRIGLQVIEKEILMTMEEIRKKQREIDQGILGAKAGKTELELHLKSLQRELFMLQNSGDDAGTSMKQLSGLLTERFAPSVDESTGSVKKLSKSMKDLNDSTPDDINFLFNPDIVGENQDMIDLIDDINNIDWDHMTDGFKIEEEETFLKKDYTAEIDALRKFLSESMNLIAEHYRRRVELIDMEIEAKKKEVQESKDREEELKQIAKERGLDADESINEERERQKRALAEQQDLERKKQRAEALIAALQLLAAKVEAGEGNPVQNIKNQIASIKGFIQGAFYKGTKTTLGDELGYTGKKDSHLILADENEAIFNPSQTAALGIGRGGNTTDDIVRIYKNSIQSDAMASRSVAAAKNKTAEGLVGKKLDKLIQATQKRMPDVGKMAYDTITEAFVYQTPRAKYIYPKSKRR